MALMLAPYNEAMRVGMGFNSYTQQLCVNDIVRKPGGVRASERDLRSYDPTKDMAPTNSGSEKGMLTDGKGTMVKESLGDLQDKVSQVVSWRAEFVDNLSDVTDSLNISGALKITCAAIGGGGKGAGHYIDESKFIKSDARYHIQVQVTNQRLVADDVTEFTPIPNVQASKFNEVYGDCFISGFIEGGVLDALVLKKLKNDHTKKDMGGEIGLKMDVKVAQIEGEVKASKLNEDTEKNEETTITISWSGGGDIKPDDIKDWDVKTLTTVAMEFPDRVAKCPQKTYAILTKYTSLRSFHEQTVKGSPLDYEIAGIYTNALLDAYMEYKSMWGDLNQNIKEVNKGTSRLRRRETDDKLIAYGKEVKGDYEKRMAKYNDVKTALAKRSVEYSNQITLEEPLPANDVEPYPADSFGLDKAARDCRFEMIKIVREVNEVTADPKVATDPFRNWRYLSPHVFRMLLPTDKEPLPSPEEIAKMKSDLEAKIKECREKEQEAQDARNERDALKAKSNAEVMQLSGDASNKEKELVGKLTTKESELEALRQEVKDKESQIQKASSEAREKDSQLQRANAQVSEIAAQERDIEARFRSALEENERIKQEHDRLWESMGNVRIDAIVWGGRDVKGDAAVFARVLQNLQNYWHLTFSNETFGCDPQPGVLKSGFIDYCRKGGSPNRITCQEYQSVHCA